MTSKRLCSLFASAAALTAVLALSASQPAGAQQRKSIRWAVASIDTYSYKVAASVTKMIEEALGGEYTVTVNPYPSTTAAMKATMDGDGEIGYTADVGMEELYAGEGGFRNYKPSKSLLVGRCVARTAELLPPGLPQPLRRRPSRATATGKGCTRCGCSRQPRWHRFGAAELASAC